MADSPRPARCSGSTCDPKKSASRVLVWPRQSGVGFHRRCGRTPDDRVRCRPRARGHTQGCDRRRKPGILPTPCAYQRAGVRTGEPRRDRLFLGWIIGRSNGPGVASRIGSRVGPAARCRQWRGHNRRSRRHVLRDRRRRARSRAGLHRRSLALHQLTVPKCPCRSEELGVGREPSGSASLLQSNLRRPRLRVSAHTLERQWIGNIARHHDHTYAPNHPARGPGPEQDAGTSADADRRASEGESTTEADAGTDAPDSATADRAASTDDDPDR
jgi:hypothetical protein